MCLRYQIVITNHPKHLVVLKAGHPSNPQQPIQQATYVKRTSEIIPNMVEKQKYEL